MKREVPQDQEDRRVGTSARRNVGAAARRNDRTSARRNAGLPTHRLADSPTRRPADVPTCRPADPPGPDRAFLSRGTGQDRTTQKARNRRGLEPRPDEPPQAIMNLDLSAFSGAQQQALLDLLVLSMYLDRHLGAGEDERAKRLLIAMGCATPYDRQRTFADSVTRVRQYAENAELSRLHTSTLAKAFTTREQCRQVCMLLEDLVSCDGDVTPPERNFLNQLRDIFQV